MAGLGSIGELLSKPISLYKQIVPLRVKSGKQNSNRMNSSKVMDQ